MTRKERDLLDLPCPRCKSADTIPVRRFGYPMTGKKEGSGLWVCLECARQFDGPKVPR